MGHEYSWEVREKAEELYIIEGCTYEQVAQATGVSATQIKRWAASDSWGERRREYRHALAQIKRDTVVLRKNMVRRALQSLNPQDVYAVARLEALYSSMARREDDGLEATVTGAVESREIRTPREAVTVLEEVVERRLNALLAAPATVNLAAIKDLKACLDMIDGLKARYGQAEGDEAAGADDEARHRLVEEVNKLLGVV